MSKSVLNDALISENEARWCTRQIIWAATKLVNYMKDWMTAQKKNPSIMTEWDKWKQRHVAVGGLTNPAD